MSDTDTEQQKGVINNPLPTCCNRKKIILEIFLHLVYISLFIALFLSFKYNLTPIEKKIASIAQQENKRYVEIEELQKQVHMVGTSIKVLKNTSSDNQEKVIKNAYKFVEVKQIYLIKTSISKSIFNAINLLEQFALSTNKFTQNKIDDFLNTNKNLIKSNLELIGIVDSILQENKNHNLIFNNQDSLVKKYLSKLVSIKTSKDYEQEKIILEKLTQVKNAISKGDIEIALEYVSTIPHNINSISELQNYLEVRKKLEKLLDNILMSMLQDD